MTVMYSPAEPLEDAFLIFPSGCGAQSLWKRMSLYLLEQFFEQVRNSILKLKRDLGLTLKYIFRFLLHMQKVDWPGIDHAQFCMKLS